jgi:tRNA (guanine37-N1)-methyltransferase
MKSRALVVPRSRGESTRRALATAGLLRHDLEIDSDRTTVVFPLVPEGDVPADWGTVIEREFDARPDPAGGDYRTALDWPEEEKAKLPRSFDVVGETVLVRIPPALAPRQAEIGEALLRFVPHARIVGWDRGVHGPERRRRIETIAGSGGWWTQHRENGIVLDVDLERAYFSPRLAREHALVAAEVEDGESVYDLCCGVGPFSVTIARDGRARSITAVDANPDAIALLRKTLARYSYGGRVHPVEQRVEQFVADRPPVERVILNLPHEGIKYAPSVARLVALRGRLYYYEVVARTELEGRAEVVGAVLGPPGAFVRSAQRVVHPYSPESDLIGFVFERAAV